MTAPAPSSADRPLRVAQLVWRLGEYLQSSGDFRDLWIEGEVSNTRAYPSGVVYFALKESNAALDAVISARNAASMALMPRDGLKVLVHGNVELSLANGRCQIKVDEVRPAGAGEAYLRREALRRRLEAEGLFKPERKRPLPVSPRRVGVVTSPSGAVWHDIQVVIARRDPSVELVFAPSQVQGGGAPDALIAALDGLSLIDDLDCVILARGGGSAEDLAAFDDEALARRIVRMKVPVCVGVGHETDVTIADHVADRRAATPSNAAELVVPDRSGALEQARGYRRQLVQRIRAAIVLRRTGADRMKQALDRRAPQARLDAFRQRADVLLLTVARRVNERRDGSAARLGAARAQLDRRGPQPRIRTLRAEAASAIRGAQRAITRAASARRTRLTAVRRLLESTSPLAVLGRGYAIVEGPDGRVRVSARSFAPGERARLRMRDGRVVMTVDEVIDG